MSPSLPTSGSSGARATAKAALPVTRAAARTDPTTVFVELGESAQQAQIARDGIQVFSPAIDEATLNQIFIGRPKVVAKVLTQSVKAGTPVPKGTTIDIELAEPGSLPATIVKGVHLGLQDQTLGSVFDQFLKDNAAVRGVVARNERAETLSTADQAVLKQAFARREVPITDEPGESIAEAFQTLQAAFTFGI